MKKLLLATGQPKIDSVIADKIAPSLGYEVIGLVEYKRDLYSKVNELNPELVIISKNLSGKELTILETIMKIKSDMPSTRIIYLAGELDERNKDKVSELATLVLAGIYDIIHEKSISVPLLKEVILHPREREQVQYLVKHIKTNVVYEDEIVEIEDEVEVEDIEEDGYKNVFLVSSIKPGTGKSFISCNLATCLAKFGAKKSNGKPPKVAIIEGDLQNLSVGTILQVESEDKNLKTVMKEISTIIDKDDNLIDDGLRIKGVNDFIKSSFHPYKQAPNLFALVGSQLSMDEVEDIKESYYIYLIERILDEFDIIVIDTNSSLAHITTYPLLRMANTAFYVIDLDFNNIRNNLRYQQTLKEMNVFNKIRYVLNKDITEENRLLSNRGMVEDLSFGADDIENLDDGLSIISRIPELPPEVFLNRLFEGIPVILDGNDYTLKVRYEISKMANEIWPIENLDWLETQNEKYKEKLLAPKKKGLFSR